MPEVAGCRVSRERCVAGDRVGLTTVVSGSVGWARTVPWFRAFSLGVMSGCAGICTVVRVRAAGSEKRVADGALDVVMGAVTGACTRGWRTVAALRVVEGGALKEGAVSTDVERGVV